MTAVPLLDTPDAAPTPSDRARRRGLVAFFAIAFGGGWLWVLGANALGQSLVNPLVQLPFAFMPALGAIVARRWVTREGFADAGLGLRLRGAWPYYVAAWLGPLAITAGAAGTAVLLGLWDGDLAPLRDALPGVPWWLTVLLLVSVMPLLAPVYWGEEFGWTSYLRPRIGGGQLRSITVTGLIWAVWHYPLAFVGYVEFGNVGAGLLVWTVSFLLQEMLLAWLFIRSGSIWTAALAHAGNNMVLSLLLAVLMEDPDGGDGLGATTLTWLPIVPMAVLCGWLLWRGAFRGGARKSPRRHAR
ncbi:CPBP family intramembrane glutamic endopeptidase [Streptomyces sp. NBRC 109706]|uniref:CPBP family intramembrane glutamic endopeptidase n=1 Tax=Streptomyces sp. NBRC 109706 TaxID=1550035 RepID=UPI000A3F21AE|nr:type II CAAX endopeptidase family protein [Streptomyces sp. NBRC 109706]